MKYTPRLAQYYGRSRQCGRPVGAGCSIGLGWNPLMNGLIQHTFKLNLLFVEKLTVIPLVQTKKNRLITSHHDVLEIFFCLKTKKLE